MYEKKDRKFVPDTIRETTWYGSPYKPRQWELEAVAKGRGYYDNLSLNYFRRFSHIQARKHEEEVRTDPDCRYHKIKYVNWCGMSNPWDDYIKAAYANEKMTWKRHTKCRKQWQKNLKNS